MNKFFILYSVVTLLSINIRAVLVENKASLQEVPSLQEAFEKIKNKKIIVFALGSASATDALQTWPAFLSKSEIDPDQVGIIAADSHWGSQSAEDTVARCDHLRKAISCNNNNTIFPCTAYMVNHDVTMDDDIIKQQFASHLQQKHVVLMVNYAGPIYVPYFAGLYNHFASNYSQQILLAFHYTAIGQFISKNGTNRLHVVYANGRMGSFLDHTWAYSLLRPVREIYNHVIKTKNTFCHIHHAVLSARDHNGFGIVEKWVPALNILFDANRCTDYINFLKTKVGENKFPNAYYYYENDNDKGSNIIIEKEGDNFRVACKAASDVTKLSEQKLWTDYWSYRMIPFIKNFSLIKGIDRSPLISIAACCGCQMNLASDGSIVIPGNSSDYYDVD